MTDILRSTVINYYKNKFQIQTDSIQGLFHFKLISPPAPLEYTHFHSHSHFFSLPLSLSLTCTDTRTPLSFEKLST